MTAKHALNRNEVDIQLTLLISHPVNFCDLHSQGPILTF